MKDLAQKLACYRKCLGYVIFTSISTGLTGDCDFLLKSAFISETVRDMPMVAVER